MNKYVIYVKIVTMGGEKCNYSGGSILRLLADADCYKSEARELKTI